MNNNSNAPVGVKKQVKKGKKGRKAPNKGFEQSAKLLERIENQDKELRPYLRYAVINKNLGNGRLEVKCVDGTILQAQCRDEHGRKSHKIGVRHIAPGDIIMIKLDEFSSSNSKKIGYVVERYTPENVARLRRFKDIPSNFGIENGFGSGKIEDDTGESNESGVTFSVNIKKKEVKKTGQGMDIYAMLDNVLGKYESDEYESESDELPPSKKMEKEGKKEDEEKVPVSPPNDIVMDVDTATSKQSSTMGSVTIQKPVGVGMGMKKGGKKSGKKLNMDKLMDMNLSLEGEDKTLIHANDKRIGIDDGDDDDDEEEFRRQLIEEQEELIKEQKEREERQKRKKHFNKANIVGSSKFSEKKTADISLVNSNASSQTINKTNNKIISGDGDVVDIDDI